MQANLVQALVSDHQTQIQILALSFHMSLSFRFSVCEIETRTVNLCHGVVEANDLLITGLCSWVVASSLTMVIRPFRVGILAR